MSTVEDAAIGTLRVFKFGLKNVNHMAYAVRDEGTEWVCDCLNTELRLPHDERWFRCELFPEMREPLKEKIDALRF